MSTPVLISRIVYPHFVQPQNQWIGPYEYGDYLYAVLAEELVVNGSSFLRVYRLPKATPEAAWVEQDAGNHPSCGSNLAGIYFDGDATIYVAYDDSGPILLRSFSLATETWGSLISTYSTHDPTSYILLTGNGDGKLLMYYVNSADLFAYAVVWDGTTWGNLTRVDNLSAGQRATFMQMIRDDDDLAHLFWSPRASAGTSAPGYHRTFGFDGAIGPVNTAVTEKYRVPGVGVEWDDKVSLMYGEYQSWSSVHIPRIVYGTPTDAPVWSAAETVDTTEFWSTAHFLVNDGGTLWAWWISNPTTIWYASKEVGGSWGAPQLFYDSLGASYIDQDGNSVAFAGENFLHQLSVTKLTDGSWGVLFGGVVDSISTSFYMTSSAVTPPECCSICNLVM
jgi:hypothetical protein